MDRPTCDTCPHYFALDDPDEGICARYPPVLVAPMRDRQPPVWEQPPVAAGSGCGEHPGFWEWVASVKPIPLST